MRVQHVIIYAYLGTSLKLFTERCCESRGKAAPKGVCLAAEEGGRRLRRLHWKPQGGVCGPNKWTTATSAHPQKDSLGVEFAQGGN